MSKKLIFVALLVTVLFVSMTASVSAAPDGPNRGQSKKVADVVVAPVVVPAAQPAPAAPVAAATPAAPANPERTTPGTYHHFLGNGICQQRDFSNGQKPNAEWETGPCPSSQVPPVASETPVTPTATATDAPEKVTTPTTVPVPGSTPVITCAQATTSADCPNECELRSEQLKLIKTTNRLMPLVEKVLNLLVQYLEKLLTAK